MSDIDYQKMYDKIIDKLVRLSNRMPSRSLDDIIESYKKSVGLNISSSKLKLDVIEKIASNIGCSVCGEYGKMFKVGDDDDICEKCKGGDIDITSRDVTPNPARAQDTTMASLKISRRVNANKVSMDDTLDIIKKRLSAIKEDYSDKALGRNMDTLLSQIKMILSGQDREFKDLQYAGTDAAPAILNKAFTTYNLSRSTKDVIINDDIIRKAIADYIGEPNSTLIEPTGHGIDDLSESDLAGRDEENMGGVLSAIEAIG